MQANTVIDNSRAPGWRLATVMAHSIIRAIRIMILNRRGLFFLKIEGTLRGGEQMTFSEQIAVK